ncbi:MAG: VTT domain-containing protein [Proteobacteria bacterium]|nr:VTT domain-containing protein [Pseudomonadota bacterium]
MESFAVSRIGVPVDEIGETAHKQLLQPGRNAWRVARARHATILIDAAAYYGALRAALRQARHSIYIVGWDVDSRMRLVGETGAADDGLPEELGDFLDALARQRPELQIRILLWDYSVFFADEREPLPALALRWKRLPQIDLCLDATVPLGASHHQKIVVIDDGIAFCGGLDLTIRRWDDPCHRAGNSGRCDPGGKPYPPFHDVQAMLDGPAATALSELVRTRWQRAACETPAGPAEAPPNWPAEVLPDFWDIDTGIARTEPAFEDRPEIREVEELFVDMISTARRHLYIESQYLTLTSIAGAIARQLACHPTLEVVIICPRSYHGVMERQAMLPGRSDFIRLLEGSKASNRWLIAAPRAAGDTAIDVSVHSKVMIVDDRYLRIGSANLCNRSMATDSECDIVFTAADASASAQIRRMRLRLMAEHCGCTVERLRETIGRQGSLVRAMHTLITRTGRAHFISAEEERAAMPILKSIADPDRPIDLQHLVEPISAVLTGQKATWALMTAMLVGFCALTAAWGFTPIGDSEDVAVLENSLIAADNPWAGFIVVATFVLAGFVAFPLLVLIVATVAMFGLWPGLAYAAAGAMASAVATYAIGRWLGNRALRRFFGPRLNRISAAFLERGVMAVTVIRLIPGAPYTLVNLAAGALRIHPVDYVIGTALGLAPGFTVMALLGRQVMDVIREPTPLGILALFALFLLSVGLSFGLQQIIDMWRKRNA